MKIYLIIISILTIFVLIVEEGRAEQVVTLSTINWQPYTGESLPDHGFFSAIVEEAFSRVGYRVIFQYRPWARALLEAKRGAVHGVMVAYRTKDRAEYLEFPNVVWKVREDFVALRENPVSYNGSLTSLQGYTIGVLNQSLQAHELKEAGMNTMMITDQIQNVKMLLNKRIDAMLIPLDVFFYHLSRIEPEMEPTRIKILQPAYKTYDMYVAFSKKRANYAYMTDQFNQGLDRIKSDGTFNRILNHHHIMIDSAAR